MKALALFAFCLMPAFGQANRRPFALEELSLPPGFQISVHARVTGGPRHLTIGPNGVLYATGYNNGTVVAIPEPDRVVTILRGLNGPHTLAFREGSLYVGLRDAVVRYSDAVTEDFVIHSQPRRLFTLPTGGHATRSIGFAPDGGLFVSIGSSCNFCLEADSRRAAILRYDADGTNQTIYARGLRNSVGFAWHPVSGELWAGDNGGDNLGDNEPPEEVNIVREGGDYGWPDCVGSRRPANWGAQARPGRCPDTVVPQVEYQAHSAPLGLTFYTGDNFPLSYKNDAFVAFHGSWNRSVPTGYKLVRIHAASGRATGTEDFLTGFLSADNRTTSGRPVHAVTAPDGALFVSDDSTGNIYRIEYAGPRIDENGVTFNEDTGLYTITGRRLMTDTPPQVSVNDISAEIVNASDTRIDFLMPDVHGGITIKVTTPVATDTAQISVE